MNNKSLLLLIISMAVMGGILFFQDNEVYS